MPQSFAKLLEPGVEGVCSHKPVTGTDMHTIHADIAKNCLRIEFKGLFDLAEAKEVAAKLIAEAKKLKPGFSAVNDVREYLPAGDEVAEIIHQAQLQLKTLGIGRVVRVVGHAHVAAMQLARTGRDAGYSGDGVATPEDADAVVEGAPSASQRSRPKL